jgi:hypothetical protein
MQTVQRLQPVFICCLLLLFFRCQIALFHAIHAVKSAAAIHHVAHLRRIPYLCFMLADFHDKLTSLMLYSSNLHLNLSITHAKIPAQTESYHRRKVKRNAKYQHPLLLGYKFQRTERFYVNIANKFQILLHDISQRSVQDYAQTSVQDSSHNKPFQTFTEHLKRRWLAGFDAQVSNTRITDLDVIKKLEKQTKITPQIALSFLIIGFIN